jgi:hypothetical protein
MSNEIQGTFFTQKELVKARDWKTLAMILRQALKQGYPRHLHNKASFGLSI